MVITFRLCVLRANSGFALYSINSLVFITEVESVYSAVRTESLYNPYPTAFPYGNGMVLHFYQQQESSTTKTVHRVINKRLKTYV